MQKEKYMLTAELKINGTLIAVLYGHNTGDQKGEFPDVECNYEFVTHVMNSTESFKFDLWHRYNNGIASLVSEALSYAYKMANFGKIR